MGGELVPNTRSLNVSDEGLSSWSSSPAIHLTFSRSAFPTVLVSIDDKGSVGELDVVASNNLNAEAIFSHVQISGCRPSGSVPEGKGAASKNDFSK